MEQKEIVINKRAFHIGLTVVAIAALVEWVFGFDGIFSKTMTVVVAVVVIGLSYLAGVFIDALINGGKKGSKE